MINCSWICLRHSTSLAKKRQSEFPLPVWPLRVNIDHQHHGGRLRQSIKTKSSAEQRRTPRSHSLCFSTALQLGDMSTSVTILRALSVSSKSTERPRISNKPLLSLIWFSFFCPHLIGHILDDILPFKLHTDNLVKKLEWGLSFRNKPQQQGILWYIILLLHYKCLILLISCVMICFWIDYRFNSLL